MPDINQNFSVAQGTDIVVDYDIGPDTTGLNLAFADVVVQFWASRFGVPDIDAGPVLVKDKDNGGVLVTDPLFLQFSLVLNGADTEELECGNYFYKVLVVNHSAVPHRMTYPTYGHMTVLRSD